METKNRRKPSTRLIALEALNRILLESAYPDLVLDSMYRKNPNLPEKEVSFINELVFGVVRWSLKLDYVISLYAARVRKKEILNLLRLGVYQVLFLDGVPDYAAISEAVSTAKALYGDRVGSFVNAVLREVVRKRDSIVYPRLDDDPIKYISIKYSFPPWLIKRWIDTLGTGPTEKLCHAYNQVPALTLRTNTLRTTREELMRIFLSREIDSTPTVYSPDGITLMTRADPSSIPEFGLGLFTVQDEASQLISRLLDPQPGERILDACSAPGGKATHIAELMENKGEIIALDINESRLALVERQAKRLGIKIIRTVCGDASSGEVVKEFLNYFDKVLVDAPCSGLGTIRRNPDIKWRKGEGDILELSEIQFKILSQAAKMVSPRGVLLYSVCTLVPEENEKLCERFLKENPEFEVDNERTSVLSSGPHFVEDGGFFTTGARVHDMDGFFAARFRKTD